jgi:hypothetical protein
LLSPLTFSMTTIFEQLPSAFSFIHSHCYLYTLIRRLDQKIADYHHDAMTSQAAKELELVRGEKEALARIVVQQEIKLSVLTEELTCMTKQLEGALGQNNKPEPQGNLVHIDHALGQHVPHRAGQDNVCEVFSYR